MDAPVMGSVLVLDCAIARKAGEALTVLKVMQNVHMHVAATGAAMTANAPATTVLKVRLALTSNPLVKWKPVHVQTIALATGNAKQLGEDHWFGVDANACPISLARIVPSGSYRATATAMECATKQLESAIVMRVANLPMTHSGTAKYVMKK
jgi:hypothetical protein